mmetsp:Transcript_33061/g.71967  ORF Transcript_33061/g.71967 Transcript_33061/m.71967 type:complete len:341 (-) Transcript_33061:182-1204(-)
MALLSALGHVASLGQFVEIGQGHAHQREQIRWSRRGHALDSQALKVDLLGAARDDIRGTYDTYVERLDALLLLNALLLPFALNSLQFSDQFVPGLGCSANLCVESEYPVIYTAWVYLVGIDLVMPFWAILLLLLSRMKLDGWLQQTLEDLHDLRRSIMPQSFAKLDDSTENSLAEEQQQTIARLGTFIVRSQDGFMDLWTSQCAAHVTWATRFLWVSAYVAIAMTAFMFWIFLVDRPEGEHHNHVHFLCITLVGLLGPVVAYAWSRRNRAALSISRSTSGSTNGSTNGSTASSFITSEAHSRSHIPTSSSGLFCRSSSAPPCIDGSQAPDRSASRQLLGC